MIICVDIDNILNDLTAKTLELYNSNNGKNIQLSDITTYNFADCLPQEDADKIVKLFKNKKLWDSVKPLSGSQEGLKRLVNMGHKIYLGTATDPINFKWKCDFISRYFPFVSLDNVIRIMNKGLLKVDVLIDDHLDNLISSFSERVTLDYPWNQNTSKDFAYSIRRAYNWSDIVDIINNIEEEMKKWEAQ